MSVVSVPLTIYLLLCRGYLSTKKLQYCFNRLSLAMQKVSVHQKKMQTVLYGLDKLKEQTNNNPILFKTFLCVLISARGLAPFHRRAIYSTTRASPKFTWTGLDLCHCIYIWRKSDAVVTPKHLVCLHWPLPICCCQSFKFPECHQMPTAFRPQPSIQLNAVPGWPSVL